MSGGADDTTELNEVVIRAMIHREYQSESGASRPSIFETVAGDAVRVPPGATRQIANGDTHSQFVLTGAP